MPAILERCVRHVKDSGKDESSAWAICRSLFYLKEDGIEDQKELALTEDELDKKLISAGYPMNPESTTKIEKAGYGGTPPQPRGLTDAPGMGADTGKDSLPTPKPGPAKPNPEGNPGPDNRVAQMETFTPGHETSPSQKGDSNLRPQPSKPKPTSGEPRPTVTAGDRGEADYVPAGD